MLDFMVAFIIGFVFCFLAYWIMRLLLYPAVALLFCFFVWYHGIASIEEQRQVDKYVEEKLGADR